MRCPRGVWPTVMVAVLAVGATGCASFPDPLVRRASIEFECEPTRINVIERSDIGYEVYDVEACGQRVRYSCVGGYRYERYHCIHEPDPPRWDPDPALAADIPSSASPKAPSSRLGQRRRICGPQEHECAFKQAGFWYWRPRPACDSSSYGSMCE